MKVFAKQLERHISLNRLEQAVDTLLETISNFTPSTSDAKSESRELRNQVIALSQRLRQATDNLKKGLSTDEDVSRERLNISTNLLDLIGDMDRYPNFKDFLSEKEDEDAWAIASRSNTIAAYQDYFNKFPNGKYTDQTQDLIRELQDVERRRAEEMKQIAIEEKKRRDQQQSEARRNQARKQEPTYGSSSSTPPPRRERPKEPPVRETIKSPSSPPPRRASFGTRAPGNEGKEAYNRTYFIIAYLVSLVIGPTGIVVGLYVRLTKKDGDFRFDENSRNQAIYLIIFSIISWAVGTALLNGGF